MPKQKYFKPICPRCGSKNTRAIGENATIICQHCGYSAHWRQFFEGEKERERVQKLFAESKLEGSSIISTQKSNR